MRAYTLNGSRMGAGPENVPDAVSTSVLPNGDFLVQQTPEAREGGWAANADKLKGWLETGKKVQDSGSNALGDFPFGAALTAMVSGAAAGSAIPGIGTVAGAIIAVGVVVVNWAIGLIGGQPSQWDGAGPNVHWWFTNYAPQAFLDYVVQTFGAPTFTDVQSATRALLMYQMERHGSPLWPDHRTVANGVDDNIYVYNFVYGVDYSNADPAVAYAKVREFYAALGVDWDATRELWNTEGRSDVLMYKRATVISPDEVQDSEPEPLEGGSSFPVVPALLATAAAVALSR